MFTDFYGEQSCTAGRASFITGQSGLRTGMTKVGLPGAALGLQKEDPTIAQLLKPLGYATGQFGKNHLGDRNEFLPTVHGFDEFYGNLYHLNAEEEPELPDYPKNPDFPRQIRPARRARLQGLRQGRPDGRSAFRHGSASRSAQDTGPLTKARMVTIDDDIANRAVDFIKREHEAGKPFFVWVNFTHMHFRTHTKPESIGQAGRWQSPYHDTMIDHDKNVGEVLKALDDLGLDDNTFVMYSTDNGPHMNSWPDAAMTPFRNEKNSNWEGAYRVPAMFRWPGHIKPDTVVERHRLASRHVPDHPGDGGRSRRRERTAQGQDGRRHDLQGPSRRLQHGSLPDRPERQGPARIVLLHQRRPAARRPALRQLETCVHEAGNAWHAARSGPTRSRRCGFPKSTISGPILTSGRRSPRTPITTGCSTTPSCSSRRRIMSASS